MSHREILFCWLILPVQFALCALVYFRHLQRQLPFFAAYALVLLAGNIVTGLVYYHFGYRSLTSYYVAWIAAGVHIAARSLVVAELCHYGLRAYKGIWVLASRLLAVMALYFIGHAAVDAWGQPNRLAIYGLTIERDIAISSVVILLTLLLIRNYYGLALDPLHRWVAVGVCLLCVVDVVNNTVLHNFFTGYLFSWFSTGNILLWPSIQSQVQRVNDLWNAIRFVSSMISMGVWCYALRSPLPEPARGPVLLPAEVYGDLSPAINLRLRAFNDRLLEMLKP
jgi:hypothetical protein